MSLASFRVRMCSWIPNEKWGQVVKRAGLSRGRGVAKDTEKSGRSGWWETSSSTAWKLGIVFLGSVQLIWMLQRIKSDKARRTGGFQQWGGGRWPWSELLAVDASKGKDVERMGRKWSPECTQQEVHCGKEWGDGWRERIDAFKK